MKSIENISRDLITAGGLVINKDNKVLFIYRKNMYRILPLRILRQTAGVKFNEMPKRWKLSRNTASK